MVPLTHCDKLVKDAHLLGGVIGVLLGIALGGILVTLLMTGKVNDMRAEALKVMQLKIKGK